MPLAPVYNLLFHYGVELLGSMILAITLLTVLQKTAIRNAIQYLASAFLVITAKDAFLITNAFLPLIFQWPPIKAYAFTIPDTILIWINLSLTSLATALFFTSAISAIRGMMSYFFFSLICTFILIGTGYLVSTSPECQKYFDILPTVYIASAFFIVGFSLLITRLKNPLLPIRSVGIGFLILGGYYTYQIFLQNPIYWVWQAFIYFSVLLISLVSQIKLMHIYCTTLENSLQTELAKETLLLESSPFPILISRLRDDKVLIINNEAQKLFDLTPQDIENFQFSNYFVNPVQRIELISKIKKETIINSFEVQLKNPRTQQTFWLDLSTRVIELDKELALYTTFKDTTGRKQKEDDLFLQASTDPLTGLYNRRQFEVMAEAEFARVHRYKTPCCLIMLDIDFFKKINDTYGHLAGDNLLQQLAVSLRKELRDSDILARYGGEEFIILLSQTTPENAMAVADRLRTTASQISLVEKGEEIRFTISLGVSDCALFDNLLAAIEGADLALYQAKKTGRNKVCSYDSSLETEKIRNP